MNKTEHIISSPNLFKRILGLYIIMNLVTN